jgi:hypothetical protein
MFKLILVGVWACLVTLASSYATTFVRAAHARSIADPAQPMESRKTKEINIPKISKGAVEGYVVIQFVYVANAEAVKKLPVPPDAFVVDEAFRYIYNDDTIDFKNPRKYDLQLLSKNLIRNVNARLKSDVVVDIAIQEFSFLSSSDVKQHL